MLKYKYISSNKIHGGIFIKQRSETATVLNYQNVDGSFKKNYRVIY